MILIIDAPDIKKKWRITNDGTLSFKLERWQAPGRNPKTGTISQREHDVFGHPSWHSMMPHVVSSLLKEAMLSQDEATSLYDAIERAEKSILAALQKALVVEPSVKGKTTVKDDADTDDAEDEDEQDPGAPAEDEDDDDENEEAP